MRTRRALFGMIAKHHMAKKKNPAAVALGRLGGKKTGIKKGFGAMTPEKLAEAHAKSLAARRRKDSA
jgi:hypothetical protein